MRIERSMHPDFLSNTYLVVDDDRSYFVDAGGPVAPLLELAGQEGITPGHVLLTHHHHDHVAELGAITERFPDIEVLAHRDEPVDGVTRRIEPGEVLPGITALHTPGHTAGTLSVHPRDVVLTGDTLLNGSGRGVL